MGVTPLIPRNNLSDVASATTARSNIAALGGSLGSTDNRLLRSDGTGGATAQGSAVTVDDSGNMTGVVTLTATTGIISSGYVVVFGAGCGLNYNGASIKLPGSAAIAWGANLDAAWRTRLYESAAGTLTVDNGSGGAASLAITGNLTASGTGSFGDTLTTAGNLGVGQTGSLYWANRSRITSPSDGAFNFLNNAANGWATVQCGAMNVQGSITAVGNIQPNTDGLYDIGIASPSANRFRDLRLSRDAYIGGNLTASGTGTFAGSQVLISTVSTLPAIWLGTAAVASPGTSNYALLRSPGQSTVLNAGSGEELHFRIANSNMGVISATGASFGGNVSATNNIQAEGMLISGLGTYGSLTPGFVATASSTMTLRTVSGTAANLVVGGSGEFSGCNIYSGTGYGIFDSGAPNANGLILRINGNTNVLSTQPVVSSGTIYVNNLTASGTVTLGPFTFGTLPSAAANAGAIVRITDRGQRIAYSDGTNWRFVSDDSIVS